MTIKFTQDHVGPGVFVQAGTVASLPDWREQAAIRRGYAVAWDDETRKKRERAEAAAEAKRQAEADQVEAAKAEAIRDQRARQVGPSPIEVINGPIFGPGVFLPTGWIGTLPATEAKAHIDAGRARKLSVDEAVALLAEG